MKTLYLTGLKYLFRTIPKHVAREWLVQVEQLEAKIKENEAKAS